MSNGAHRRKKMKTKKSPFRRPKISDAEWALNHAVVRGDQAEIDRLRKIVADEKKQTKPQTK
jgi:hypothetical protein